MLIERKCELFWVVSFCCNLSSLLSQQNVQWRSWRPVRAFSQTINSLTKHNHSCLPIPLFLDYKYEVLIAGVYIHFYPRPADSIFQSCVGNVLKNQTPNFTALVLDRDLGVSRGHESDDEDEDENDEEEVHLRFCSLLVLSSDSVLFWCLAFNWSGFRIGIRMLRTYRFGHSNT